MNRGVVARNVLGAVSDGAVLFPLLALLAVGTGLTAWTLLLTTGLAYLAAALCFRVPMSVQPLKSIAVAAITVGATSQEVRLSGFLLGAICLGLGLTHLERVMRRVPAAVVHQLQAGLGVLLAYQGVRTLGGWDALLGSGPGLGALGAAALMVVRPELGGLPVLGLVATVGLLIAVFGGTAPAGLPEARAALEVRPGLVASLLIPQVILTLGNSVLATEDVCRRYFGPAASRVTVRRLLGSIGIGNILVAWAGGMPFCHGSGGVTAHVRGGSTRAWSTGLMGCFLLALAALQLAHPSRVLAYPPAVGGALLMAIGAFHLGLAAPTAATIRGRWQLASAAIVTTVTGNLLWVLAAAALWEVLPKHVWSNPREVKT